MKKGFCIWVLIFLLSACASGPTAYGPAKSYQDVGFRSQQLQKDRFQISFTARDADEARALALLRAAEITKGHGYSHFRILKRDAHARRGQGLPLTAGAGIGIGKSISLGGGAVGHMGTGIALSKVLGDMGAEKITARMDIQLLVGRQLLASRAGPPPDIYEAASVLKSIRPAKYK